MRALRVLLAALVLTLSWGFAQAAPTLVKDLNAETGWSFPSKMFTGGGLLSFHAYSPESGYELWKTDGTEAGTTILKDVFPGTEFSQNDIYGDGGAVDMGTYVLFTAADGIHGYELWKSDGTPGGVSMLKDITQGYFSTLFGCSSGNNGGRFSFAKVGTDAYFVARVNNACTLIKSDGTTSGTTNRLNLTTAIGNVSIDDIMPVGSGNILITTFGPTSGNTLWNYSVATNSVTPVSSVANGQTYALYDEKYRPLSDGTYVYYVENDFLLGTETLYKTDLVNPPVQQADITGWWSSTNSVKVGNAIYSSMQMNSNNIIYKVDLTNGLVTEVSTLWTNPIAANIWLNANVLRVVGNKIVTLAGKWDEATFQDVGWALWTTDLATGASAKLVDLNYPQDSDLPWSMAVYGGKLYFANSDPFNGMELWYTDGTVVGTKLLKDLNPGSADAISNNNSNEMTVYNNQLYFAADDGVHGLELFKTSGTSVGTVLVKDINTATSFSVAMFENTNIQLEDTGALLNGVVYYPCMAPNYIGMEICRTDGTDAGTYLLNNNFIGEAGYEPHQLFAAGSKLYFTTKNWDSVANADSKDLWASDGTSAGTIKVLTGENAQQTPIFSGYPNYFAEMGGKLYFANYDSANGVELWVSNGTELGTYMVKDINPGTSGSYPTQPIVYNNNLYFSASDGVSGNELWRTDGTEAGTFMVRDIEVGAGNSSPMFFSYNINARTAAVFNGYLYFGASTTAEGRELWKTDGTSSGTTQVWAFSPGAAGSTPRNLTAVGNTLFLRANGTNDGHELYKCTTLDACSIVKTGGIYPGSSTLNTLQGLTAYNDKLFFWAEDGTNGIEPWVSDGTDAGTQMLADVMPGAGSSGPLNPARPAFNVLSDGVYFSANDGSHGFEMWKSDGVTTALYADTAPGSVGGMIAAGIREIDLGKTILYFYAHPTYGAEVFTVPMGGGGNAAPAFNAVASKTVQAGKQLSFTITATDAENELVTISSANKPTDATLTGNPAAGSTTYTFTWTPSLANVGVRSVTFDAVDVGDRKTSLTVDITVTENSAPQIAGWGSIKHYAGQNLSTHDPIVVTDAEGDTLTVTGINLPSGAILSQVGSTPGGTTTLMYGIAWVPTNAQAGPHTFTIRASDGVNTTNQNITVTVAINAAPTFAALPNQNITVGSLLKFDVTASDTNGDALTMSATNAPAAATFTFKSNTANLGTSTYNYEFAWTPGVGDVGTKLVQFSVTDGLLTTQQTVSINVTMPANLPPVISGTPVLTVAEGGSYSFTPTASDPESDALTFSIQNKPNWATFSTATGALTGNPTEANIGTTSGIVISVGDGKGNNVSLPAFNLTVTPVNDPPTITSQKNALSTKESVALAITLGDLNVTDPDSAYPGSFTLTVLPGANYTVAQNSVKPVKDFIGALTVPVKVNDGQLDSNQFDLTVTVVDNPAPNAPVVTVDSFSTQPTWSWVSGGNGVGTFRYKLDSSDLSTGATETASLSYAPSPAPGEGSHTLYVQEKNANDEWSPAGQGTVTVDTTVPTVAISAPVNSSTIKTFPLIGGTASDAGGIDNVKVQLTKGAYYLTPNLTWTNVPTWITSSGTANWELDTSVLSLVSGNTYTVKAQAEDRAHNKSAEAVITFTYDTKPSPDAAYTTLSLTVSSQTILLNGTIDLSGKLTRLPDNGADLNGKPLKVKIVDPDGLATTVDAATNSPLGHFNKNDVNGFAKSGPYSVSVVFEGDAGLAPSVSKPVSVLVGASAGYAVMLAGKITSAEGLTSHNKTANRIYKKLKKRGFTDDAIYYMNYDSTPPEGVIFDGTPSQANLTAAIQNWAADKMNASPAPLTVILVDHGKRGGLFVSPDEVTPDELNTMLNALEDKLTGAAAQQPITVVLGYCYSGSFVKALAAPGRIIVTSAAEDEESYRGPLEPDGVRSGEYFLEEFFTLLERGGSIRDAFAQATTKTESYTRKGGSSASVANRYFDDSMQHPLLEDSGDGKGSNLLGAGSDDGLFASNYYLGYGLSYITNSAANPAEFISTMATRFLDSSSTQVTISATANDNSQVSTAWCEIRKPDLSLSGKGGTTQLDVSLPKKLMALNSGTMKFEVAATDFDLPGKYEVLYFVTDDQTGDVSPMKRSLVYKNRAGNQAPADFTLTTPANGASVNTALAFLWNPTTDPDGDALTYTLEISELADFSTLAFSREEIRAPFYVVDVSAGLKDQTAYNWRVVAVDTYGMRKTCTAVFQFSTNNTNAQLSGLLTGIVYDIQTGTPITNASVASSDTESSSASMGGGYYLSSVLSADATIIISKAGYETAYISSLPTGSGEVTEVNVALVPLGGLDTTAPTVSATPAAGTYTSAVSLTLACNDGTGTGCLEIRYTLDGSEPTASSTAYTAPVALNASTVVKFYAKDNAGNESAVSSASYTVNIAPPAAGGGGGGGGGCFISETNREADNAGTGHLFAALLALVGLTGVALVSGRRSGKQD